MLRSRLVRVPQQIEGRAEQQRVLSVVGIVNQANESTIVTLTTALHLIALLGRSGCADVAVRKRNLRDIYHQWEVKIPGVGNGVARLGHPGDGQDVRGQVDVLHIEGDQHAQKNG